MNHLFLTNLHHNSFFPQDSTNLYCSFVIRFDQICWLDTFISFIPYAQMLCEASLSFQNHDFGHSYSFTLNIFIFLVNMNIHMCLIMYEQHHTLNILSMNVYTLCVYAHTVTLFLSLKLSSGQSNTFQGFRKLLTLCYGFENWIMFQKRFLTSMDHLLLINLKACLVN